MIKYILLLFILTNLVVTSQTVDKWEKVFDFQDTFALLQSAYDDGNHVLLTRTKVEGEIHVFVSTDLTNWEDKFQLKKSIIKDGKKYLHEITSLQFRNSSIFVVVELIDNQGYDNTGNLINKYKSILYKSSDLGENWEEIEFSKNFRSRKMTYFKMENESRGIFTQLPDSNEMKDRILITENGWADYKVIDTNKIKVINKYGMIISQVATIDKSDITIYTAYNEILHSSDIGETWEAAAVPVEYHKNSTSVKFQKYKDSYYLSGVVDKLVRTRDYGKTWDLVSEGSIFGAMSFFNDSIFSINVGRKLYETNDGGKSYEESYNYAAGDIYLISSVSYISKDKRIGISGNELLIENNEKYLVPPVFISPEKFYDLQPNFTVKWSENSLATSYDIMVKEFLDIKQGEILPIIDWDSGELFYSEFGRLSNEIEFKNQKPNVLYRVRLRCKNEELESQWDEMSFFTGVGTSVETQETTNINLYPNPAKEEINISYDKMINSIEILDLNGKEIISNKNLVPQMEQNIKVDYLHTGTYLIRINDNVYKRFVKE